jgi:hypothetical protein
LQVAYLAGTVDVTWHCSRCHRRPGEELHETRLRILETDTARLQRTGRLISEGLDVVGAASWSRG